MQFGLGQDLPGLVAHQSNFTRNEAWDDYNKCLDGLKLYMPSHLSTSSVTARYRDWWLKSVSEFLGSKEVQKEPRETFNARNTFDKYDDGDIDVSLKALPLIPVVQNLQEGFTVKRRRSRMRSLAKIYKIGALVNTLVSSGWKMNKTSGDLTNKRSSYESLHMKTACGNGNESSMDEEDVNMTISQIIRCGKKYSDADKPGGDASESLGKRSRRYLVADSDDDLGPCQNNASRKLEQRSEEDDETAKQPEKTRQRCDDVNGSNAEKKTMIDDRTKEAECWLHRDREKQRCIEKLCSEVKTGEDIDERLRQRKLAIKEIGVKLEARIMKVEKSLAKIRKWKTRPHNGHRNNSSRGAAWSDYNKPISAIEVCIPSRSMIPRVTTGFCEWWRKTFPEFQKYSSKEKGVVESAETSNARNIIVPSGSKMNIASNDEMDIAECLNKKRKGMEEARDKRRKYLNQAPETGSKTVAGESGKNMALIPFFGNKSSDPPLGVNKRALDIVVYGSNADLIDDGSKKPKCMEQDRDKRRKYTSQALEIGSKSMADESGNNIALIPFVGNKTSDPPLGGNEGVLDITVVYGSNADLIDDGSKKPECLLKEDGIIAGRSDEKLCSNEAEKEVDDSCEKRFEELKVMSSTLEETINKVSKKVTLMKERKVEKLRKIAAARFI
ncbi:PREDICTED: uncharacterized protein LOC104778000 [Camelina sativa]|uniref:Uncharacterized protein LOC104778000 n=1 Tax=Camelina sativa TaxID=90675 RepID=A0ABM0YGS9_CAMSA|nr:PREDICTED: uncharacterized protein LOC104778000 [Camelina sativa]